MTIREERFISVVIPNRNGAATVGQCLEAAFASDYGRFEVVVVDDASEDASVEIIRAFPCRLVRLDRHGGVSRARNAGALVVLGTATPSLEAWWNAKKSKFQVHVLTRRFGDTRAPRLHVVDLRRDRLAHVGTELGPVALVTAELASQGRPPCSKACSWRSVRGWRPVTFFLAVSQTWRVLVKLGGREPSGPAEKNRGRLR